MTERSDDETGAEVEPVSGGKLILFPTATKDPAVPTGGEVEPVREVLDGEVIADRFLTRARRRFVVATRLDQPCPGPTIAVLPRPVRVVARAAYAVGHGHMSWARRGLDAITHGGVREQVRLARLTGDREAQAEWTDRLTAVKDSRHARMRALPATLLAGFYALGALAGALVVFLVLIGIWVQLTPGSFGWGGWWSLIGSVLTGTLTAAGYLMWLALLGAIPLLIFVAWREGKRVATAPRWLASPDEIAEQTSEITPGLLAAALRHMKIPTLAKYLDGGGALEFLVDPREQGGGTYTQIKLPMGVIAAEFLTAPKTELLAGNLGRHRHETWPQRQKDTDARVLDLWIADKATMDKPAPPWPMLLDGEFDVFRDRLPWGVTMRSEQVAVGMLQKHWLVGATSKQGKSTVVRLLALGLALDITVELHIADLKGDGDWSMFAPRAVTLIEGGSDEKAEDTAAMLEWGVREVARRYEAKSAAGMVGPIPREVSRRSGSGFHPIYLIVDECQILYGAPHPIGGTKDDSRATKAAKRLHDQARAVNVQLIQATQRPDDRTLPARVREGAHVRCALNVPNAEAAKMILADAADRGARPQDLRAGADAGTVVATGEVEDIPKGQSFAIVRTHYVSTKQAYTVIARSMELIRRAGRTIGPVIEESPEETDHLANIAKVLGGTPRVPTIRVLKRLSELDPAEYESWTFSELKAALAAEGVSARKSHGVMVVAAEDVAQALADRGDPDGDEDDGVED